MQKIKLTEQQVNNIVRNSVYRILKEDWKSNLKKGAMGLGAAASLASCGNIDNQDYDSDDQRHMNQMYQNSLDMQNDYPDATIDDFDLDDEYSYNPSTEYDDGVGSHTSEYMSAARAKGRPHRLPVAESRKKVIRLTENDIIRMVNNSVNSMIKEGFFGDAKKGYDESDRIGKTGDESKGYRLGKTVGKMVKRNKR